MGQSTGDGGGSFLQDRRVQIGVGIGGVIAVIALIFMMFGNRPPAPAPVDQPGLATPDVPGEELGRNTGSNSSGEEVVGLPPGESSGMNAAAPTPAPSPAATAPAPQEQARPQPPGVPTRTNPFAPNREIRDVLASIPRPTQGPVVLAEAHDLWKELNPPKPPEQVDTTEDAGPPVPPMRVTGIVLGSQVAAVLQIGSQYMQVTPGRMIPEGNPVYRVERIETDRVVLTRRWQAGERKGVQRIEVNLAGGAAPVAPVAPGVGVPGGNRPGPGLPGES